MLYNKNSSKVLDMELFKNPGSEYRGAPFWAWNCKLTPELLTRQIEYLKEMGFGGFHMHTRSGMSTEYLSEEFMNLIRTCCDKAKKENMLAWLYDEDRWPSGAAGGLVTKTIKYRERCLLITENIQKEVGTKQAGYETGTPYLLACFDIVLNSDGTLKEYKMIEPKDNAHGKKRYAYIMTSSPSGWFNNQTYIDTLNPEAMREFIKITYETYKNKVGDEFGKTIPAIFTDEPQFKSKGFLPYANSSEDVRIPWTYDFSDTYSKTYDDNIIPKIPELIWNLPNNKVSQARYCYHDHICERFTEAFADQCGKWCLENNIALTGHMTNEPTLSSQTYINGETMRAYRSFQIPGIDILCDLVELTTAKQAQSAKNQYGCEAMLSELYGVTGWDFDFRSHKFQGDWQAALGVTVRVPHLSWVSMKGSAKRDYPASISYQSPWYKKYSYVEDHFARLNTVLTRGKPVVKIGVIHPVETFWLKWSPAETMSDLMRKYDERFTDLTKMLLTNFADFDFISEALLPSQCGEIFDTLTVGEMHYSTIIVPFCETLRSSTLEILRKFKESGGNLIFIEDCPKYIDAAPSDDAKELYKKSVALPFDEHTIVKALKDEIMLSIRNPYGYGVYNLVSTLRKDGDFYWLFIAHCEKTQNPDLLNREDLIITLKGSYNVSLFNTITGEREEMCYTVSDDKTIINKAIYAYDSLLLRLEPYSGKKTASVSEEKTLENYAVDFKSAVSYEREEDNVYPLDLASYKLDDGEIYPLEEVIRIDTKCRKILNYPAASGEDTQPWVHGEDKIKHYVTLYYDIVCENDIHSPFLAAEEIISLKLNGKDIKLNPCGYFVDESIIKYHLPNLTAGTNNLEMVVPIGKYTSIEYAYILGNFDVYIRGCDKVIKKASNTIGFGSITTQGMPFYGGNLIYKTEIETPDCSLNIRTSMFRGALVSVVIDGKEVGDIAYAPYTLKSDNLKAGKHNIEFVLYGNRYNTFGALHSCGIDDYYGSHRWYKKDYEFCYEYNTRETGILASPVIEVIEH